MKGEIVQGNLLGQTVHRVVGVSGGKDSTAMWLRLRELHPEEEFIPVCTPTGDELPEVLEHWGRLEELTGTPMVRLQHPRGLNGLIEHKQMLPNHRARWCTELLKIQVFNDFLLRLTTARYVVAYIGLRADEPGRAGVTYGHVPGVATRWPMREWGWGLREVRDYLQERGVEIPERTDCARCFFQKKIEWWRLWKRHPHIYADAERQEAMTGHTFRYGESLREMREKFETGCVPKSRQGKALRAATCRACTL